MVLYVFYPFPSIAFIKMICRDVHSSAFLKISFKDDSWGGVSRPPAYYLFESSLWAMNRRGLACLFVMRNFKDVRVNFQNAHIVLKYSFLPLPQMKIVSWDRCVLSAPPFPLLKKTIERKDIIFTCVPVPSQSSDTRCLSCLSAPLWLFIFHLATCLMRVKCRLPSFM